MCGLALLIEGGPRHRVWVGASMLGLCVLLRVHCGLFAAGAVILLFAKGRRRDAAVTLSVLLGWAIIYGLSDWWAWGSFFHSARVYLQFNVVEGRASEFGVAPLAYYTKHLTRTLGALWVSLSVLGLLGARRTPGLFAMTLLYLAVHVAIEHKELRFLVPWLPLLCVCAAAGVEELASHRWWAGLSAAAAVVLFSSISLARGPTLNVPQVGREHEARLLIEASKRDDLCGLAMFDAPLYETLGYFGLHRNVPFYEHPPESSLRHYNYAIASSSHALGTVVDTRGSVSLFRVFEGPCVTDASFDFWLTEMTRELAKKRTSP